MRAAFHSFESLAARDGIGLRCVCFLAGCPLRCVFCHNPDTWVAGEKEVESVDLVRKICRYRPYFGQNGGVTFSGGEPLLQADFLKETALLLQKEGISYVIDTSGSVPLSDSVRFVLKNSRQVLLDLKFWDEASYRRYTGGSLKPVLETLSFLDSIGKDVVLRTVVIPSVNDREEVLKKYLDRIRSFSCISRYELLPFHTMGFFKYEKLGIQNPLASLPAMDESRCEALSKFVCENR